MQQNFTKIMVFWTTVRWHADRKDRLAMEADLAPEKKDLKVLGPTFHGYAEVMNFKI